MSVSLCLRLISRHQSLVDRAIRLCLKHRRDSESASSAQLTPQDHFYRQISRVEDIVHGLQEAMEETAKDASPDKVVEAVMAVNRIVVTVLRDALQTRQRKQEEFRRQRMVKQHLEAAAATSSRKTEEEADSDFEFLPWTSTPGPVGMRTALMNQFRATAEKALPLAEDSAARSAMATQLSDLADLVLEGYRAQLDRYCTIYLRNLKKLNARSKGY